MKNEERETIARLVFFILNSQFCISAFLLPPHLLLYSPQGGFFHPAAFPAAVTAYSS